MRDGHNASPSTAARLNCQLCETGEEHVLECYRLACRGLGCKKRKVVGRKRGFATLRRGKGPGLRNRGGRLCSNRSLDLSLRQEIRFVTMASPQSNKWITFFEDNLLEDVAQPSNMLFWCQTALNEQADCSFVDNDCCKRDAEGLEKTCPRKRSRDDSCSGPGTKACREKMRRDRLNDRFMDLSALLEPGKPPKQDKATILSDTLRTLNQLRAEAQQLKDSNHQLREAIIELKAEKNELREEKQRLKTEREKLEQQIKLIMIPSGYIPHPSTIHDAMAAFAFQTQAAGTKAASVPCYPGMPMWQWMPPAALDTSNDHVLRPPVA